SAALRTPDCAKILLIRSSAPVIRQCEKWWCVACRPNELERIAFVRAHPFDLKVVPPWRSEFDPDWVRAPIWPRPHPPSFPPARFSLRALKVSLPVLIPGRAQHCLLELGLDPRGLGACWPSHPGQTQLPAPPSAKRCYLLDS